MAGVKPNSQLIVAVAEFPYSSQTLTSSRHPSITLPVICPLPTGDNDSVPCMAVMVNEAILPSHDAFTTYSPVFVPRIKVRLAVPFMVCVVVAANICVVRLPIGCQLIVLFATGLPYRSDNPTLNST